MNGKRYNINIEKFTERYNEIMFRSWVTNISVWKIEKVQGETKKTPTELSIFVITTIYRQCRAYRGG